MPRSHEYTVVPCEPFDLRTIRDINNSQLVAIVAHAGRDDSGILRVLFNV